MVDPKEAVGTRLSLLELEMSRTEQTIAKMDSNAEKHREEHSKITEKMYGRMENLREEVKSDIKELQDSFSEDLKAHRDDFDLKLMEQYKLLMKINERLDGLDKWRWMVMGATLIAGFFISKISALFGLSLPNS